MRINLRVVKKLTNHITVIVISGLIISGIFLSMPKTEQLLFSPDVRVDLNIKENDYWKKEYYIDLDIKYGDKDRTEKINETKDILYKRLQKANAEEIQVKSHKVNNSEGLKITVQSTQDEHLITGVIADRSYMRLVTPKKDLEKNDFTQIYLIENYDKTEWDRSAFRNILVKTLVDSENNRTYFAIFKPWPQNRGSFVRFLEDNKGESIGFAMDEFVRPVMVDESSKELFAVGLGPDKINAQIYDIVLNSGVIPLKYTLEDIVDVEPEIFEIKYMQVTIAIITAMLILTTYLYLREKDKKNILEFSLCLLTTFSVSFTMLKTYQIPVDLFLLLITGVLIIIFVKMIYFNKKDLKFISLFSIGFSILLIYLGTGYTQLLGQQLLFAILLALFLQRFLRYYLIKFNDILK